MHKPRRSRNKRPAARMRRTARKPNGAISSGKPAHNGNGPHRTTAVRRNDRAAGSRMINTQLHQGFAQIRVDWNNSSAAVLGYVIPQLQGSRDLTRRIDHHVPTQVSDFGGTQASLQRQQHDHLVADGMPGVPGEAGLRRDLEPGFLRACQSFDANLILECIVRSSTTSATETLQSRHRKEPYEA